MTTKSETGLYREFVKAFARKIIRVLGGGLLFLVAALLLTGVMYAVVEIASFVVDATPLANSPEAHFAMAIFITLISVGLFRIAISAWDEAKTAAGEVEDK